MIYPGFFRQFATMCTALLLLMLSACSSNPTAQNQTRQYDFGPLNMDPLSVASSGNGLPAQDKVARLQISLADISIPAALESNAMLYRLQYDNAQQLKAYALNRWSMPPAQLLAQRLKAGFTAQGADILAATDGAANLPILRMELDEFSQIFTSPSQSHAQLNLRASIIKANKLVAQKSFQQQMSAGTADGAGGAKAMQQAADACIAELHNWVASLPLR